MNVADCFKRQDPTLTQYDKIIQIKAQARMNPISHKSLSCCRYMGDHSSSGEELMATVQHNPHFQPHHSAHRSTKT